MLVTATASNVTVLENGDDDPVKGDINLRLMMLTEDLQSSVRSQAAPPARHCRRCPVAAPPAVSFCAYADDTIAVSLQGWDDDDWPRRRRQRGCLRRAGQRRRRRARGRHRDPRNRSRTSPSRAQKSSAAPRATSRPRSPSRSRRPTATATGSTTARSRPTGTDPGVADTDGDGLSDGDEVHVYGTSPTDDDDDDDGLNDGDEINVYRTNVFDPDTDDDGLTDGDEVHVYDTDPTDPDSDDDGLTDGEEVHHLPHRPHDPDTDDDWLTDGDEVHVYGTDPNDPDTDNDFLPDGVEVAYGTDPNVADSDHDGLLDGQDVEFIQNAIDSAPTNVFKSPGTKNAGLSVLEDVEAMLKQNKVAKAIQTLRELRKHFDGVRLRGRQHRLGAGVLRAADDPLTDRSPDLQPRRLIRRRPTPPGRRTSSTCGARPYSTFAQRGAGSASEASSGTRRNRAGRGRYWDT